jgi:hypothetical protein
VTHLTTSSTIYCCAPLDNAAALAFVKLKKGRKKTTLLLMLVALGSFFLTSNCLHSVLWHFLTGSLHHKKKKFVIIVFTVTQNALQMFKHLQLCSCELLKTSFSQPS